MNASRLARQARLAYHRRIAAHWFISFPKSGRTWSKRIVEKYVSLRFGVPPFTFEEYNPWLRRGPWREIPRLILTHPYCDVSDPRPTEKLMRRIAERRIMLMVRDPRKVVYTYYFRLRDKLGDPRLEQLSLAEFIRHETLGMPRIVAFINTWYDARHRFREFVLMRHEDVQNDPEREISRYLKFLDIPVVESHLVEAIESTPDETTRAIEDPAYSLTSDDLDFLDRVLSDLRPEIGYQADGR